MKNMKIVRNWNLSYQYFIILVQSLHKQSNVILNEVFMQLSLLTKFTLQLLMGIVYNVVLQFYN